MIIELVKKILDVWPHIGAADRTELIVQLEACIASEIAVAEARGEAKGVEAAMAAVSKAVTP